MTVLPACVSWSDNVRCPTESTECCCCLNIACAWVSAVMRECDKSATRPDITTVRSEPDDGIAAYVIVCGELHLPSATHVRSRRRSRPSPEHLKRTGEGGVLPHRNPEVVKLWCRRRAWLIQRQSAKKAGDRNGGGFHSGPTSWASGASHLLTRAVAPNALGTVADPVPSLRRCRPDRSCDDR